MKFVHKTFYYENGEEEKIEYEADVKDCTKSDFDRDEEMRLYY